MLSMDVAPTLAVIIVSANSEQWLVDCISYIRPASVRWRCKSSSSTVDRPIRRPGSPSRWGESRASREPPIYHANNRGLEVSIAQRVLLPQPRHEALGRNLVRPHRRCAVTPAPRRRGREAAPPGRLSRLVDSSVSVAGSLARGGHRLRVASVAAAGMVGRASARFRPVRPRERGGLDVGRACSRGPC